MNRRATYQAYWEHYCRENPATKRGPRFRLDPAVTAFMVLALLGEG